jgi:prepilin-type N-terminal cleavage/methylation domain-containing protein
MRSRPNRGFTLIEVMVTVVIIALLAAIAVPAFTKESRKSKASSEVNAMFAELAVREDQYKLENGAYLAADACPATTSPNGATAASCVATGGAWEPLRARLSSDTLVCSYTITAGTGAGTSGPAGFSFTSPAGAWFYIHATCDGDGSAAVNAQYFVSNVSSKVQKLDEGK